MNKKDILIHVAECISEQGVVRHRYYEKGCYCAVGHLARVCNMDMKPLMDNNKETVYTLGEVTLKPILDLGFSMTELDILQNTNDEYADDLERKEQVLDRLEEMIKACDLQTI